MRQSEKALPHFYRQKDARLLRRLLVMFQYQKSES